MLLLIFIFVNPQSCMPDFEKKIPSTYLTCKESSEHTVCHSIERAISASKKHRLVLAETVLCVVYNERLLTD